MNTAILDRTITISIRQIWRWTRRTLYVFIPVYMVLFFLAGWGIKMGGVSLQRSPFADRVPSFCKAYADRIGPNSTYLPESRSSVADALLLKGRVSEGYISSLIEGTDLTPQCFGYAILVGLHGNSARDADFVQRWVDKNGRVVLSVDVQYHQTLQDIGFATNKETSK